MTQFKDKNLHFDLSHFAIIEISGDDATEFLQNQLITNMPDLKQSGWLLSAWCSPKGRILANFILFEYNAQYFLILPTMLKQIILQRLNIFVLRSKVNIRDVSEHYALIGIYGEQCSDILRANPEFIRHANLQFLDGSLLIRMTDNTPRWILAAPIEKLTHIMNQAFLDMEQGNRSTWSLLDIEAGLPWVTEATSEKFLPQMLNLDDTGGLSYNKGCYPGQEIIARVHFRGEVKKRLYLGTGKGDITPGPGDQLEAIADGKLLGDIIDAEQNSTDGFSILAAANVAETNTLQACVRGECGSVIELKTV